jgi:hypothetical protein
VESGGGVVAGFFFSRLSTRCCTLLEYLLHPRRLRQAGQDPVDIDTIEQGPDLRFWGGQLSAGLEGCSLAGAGIGEAEALLLAGKAAGVERLPVLLHQVVEVVLALACGLNAA